MATLTALGVADTSNPTNPGTSDMTTTTARSTKARSTPSATAVPTTRKKSNAVLESGEVAQAVERDLVRAPAELATSGLAFVMLAMARVLDDPSTSATAKSMCARSLLDANDRLRSLMPATQEADALDDLARRREARRAGVAASKS